MKMTMETLLYNVLLWSFVFFMLGMSAFVADMNFGVKWHAFTNKWIRWFTNLGRAPGKKKPRETPSGEGYIFNRKAAVQFSYSLPLTGFWIYVMIGIRHEDPLYPLIIMLALPFAMFLGIRCGRLKLGWIKIRGKAFEALDKIDSGEINVSEETSAVAKSVVASASTAITDAGTKIKEGISGIISRKPEKPPTPAAPPTPPPPTRSEVIDRTKENIDKYTGGM